MRESFFFFLRKRETRAVPASWRSWIGSSTPTEKSHCEIYPAGAERDRINPRGENQREVGINWSHIPTSTERDTNLGEITTVLAEILKKRKTARAVTTRLFLEKRCSPRCSFFVLFSSLLSLDSLLRSPLSLSLFPRRVYPYFLHHGKTNWFSK